MVLPVVCVVAILQVVDCKRPSTSGTAIDDDAAAETASCRDLFLVIVEARCDDIQLLGRVPTPEDEGGTALWRTASAAGEDYQWTRHPAVTALMTPCLPLPSQMPLTKAIAATPQCVTPCVSCKRPRTRGVQCGCERSSAWASLREPRGPGGRVCPCGASSLWPGRNPGCTLL
jgi:hypothetical protein